ncbi:MAG: sulfatase-like hydrolase/transferase [Akkermansiaceae bacterium]|nr:sulfatase-like hydrolase/transferase [Akkermansiaceae bacterium]
MSATGGLKKWLTGALALVTLVGELQAKRPNIILVMADDQGYGDTGYTGHPFLKTPHLDAMARDSVVFNRFYAGAPVCSPTRASVLTGRTPMRTNVLHHGHYMRPAENTLAEELYKAGYRTAHFGKWHIGSVQKDSPASPGGQGFDEWLTGLNYFDRNPYLSHNGQYQQLKGQGTVLTMDAAIGFLDKHKAAQQPLFAVIWFPAPHSPHLEKSAQPNLYQDKKAKGYFQEIALLDEQVGRLRSALRKMRISDNTIVWYCSDNGGLLPESSGGRGKKGDVYEGGLRVPALLEWPEKLAHKSVSTPASTSDIYPTLLALAGVKNTSTIPLDGIDLSSFLTGKKTRREQPIGFWHDYTAGEGTYSDRIIRALMLAQKAGKPTPFPERLLKNVNEYPKRKPYANGSQPGHAALLDWPYKIHAIGDKRKGTRFELYNLEQDPMEKLNLATKEPAVFKKMKTAVLDWQASVIRSLEGGDYPAAE